MDVKCSTCEEPWDVFHLQHDEIWDTDLTEAECEAWQDLSPTLQLQPRYRDKFKENGWEFGETVLNVIRCPACPKDGKPDPRKLAIKAALEGILGDDPDGLAATLEDCGF
jgi:hypothetical protein